MGGVEPPSAKGTRRQEPQPVTIRNTFFLPLAPLVREPTEGNPPKSVGIIQGGKCPLGQRTTNNNNKTKALLDIVGLTAEKLIKQNNK
jgi:hypothetical protein